MIRHVSLFLNGVEFTELDRVMRPLFCHYTFCKSRYFPQCLEDKKVASIFI